MANRLAMFLIRMYRKMWEPIMAGAGDRGFKGRICRFEPTCSVYAQQAFTAHPFFTALKLTISRLARCRKSMPGGADPVPERLDQK